MWKTMTIAQAARWAGVSPRMLGLMLTGRLVDSLSEIDVDIDGLPIELIRSMPGRLSGEEKLPPTARGAADEGPGGSAVQAPSYTMRR